MICRRGCSLVFAVIVCEVQLLTAGREQLTDHSKKTHLAPHMTVTEHYFWMALEANHRRTFTHSVHTYTALRAETKSTTVHQAWIFCLDIQPLLCDFKLVASPLCPWKMGNRPNLRKMEQRSHLQR